MKLPARCTLKINSAQCGIEHIPLAQEWMEAATRHIPVLLVLLGCSMIKGAMDVYGHLMQEGDNDAAKMAILTLVLTDAIPGVRSSGARKHVQLLVCSLTHGIHAVGGIPCLNRWEQNPRPPFWYPQRIVSELKCKTRAHPAGCDRRRNPGCYFQDALVQVSA